MLIRDADFSDLKKCEELSKNPEVLWTNWDYYHEDFFKNYVLNDGYFLVLEENKEIIWYLLWEKLKAKWVIIWSFSIDEKFRWKWFWTQLLKKFEYNVKKDWCKWIYLVGRAGNEKLRNFYLKNNYIEGTKNIEFVKEF